MIMTMLLVAQATTSQPAPSAAPGSSYLLPGLMLFMVVFYFMLFRGRKKERQKYESLIASLKKNDRIQTIGGIYGTVVDVKDAEIVLKVDETNNVKIRVNRSAIKEVIRDGESN